ncbi:hypothetical protein LCGC14_0948110, partial [marine sediment metagenome]
MIRTRIRDNQAVDGDFLSEGEFNTFLSEVVITGTNNRDDTVILEAFDDYFPGRGLITAGSGIVVTTGTNFIEITSSGGGGGSSDHGSLTGLADDDHTQYVLEDGSRGFSSTVSGVGPVDSDDLSTKNYVDTQDVTISGHLQSEIDAVAAGNVDSVNAISGDVLVTGTQNVTTQTLGQTITVTGPDLSPYATSAEVDSDIAAVSGTLSDEIDTDIATHVTVNDAHHSRYTDSEAVSALETTTSELAASGVATDANVAANAADIAGVMSSGTAHYDDATIHFTEDTIDHTAISNIGVNSHAQVDTHLSALATSGTDVASDTTTNTSDIAGVMASGTTHYDDATIHFTEGSIDHTAISNVGSNSHPQIDTHLSALASSGTTTDSTLTSHTSDSTIHFTEASIDHTAIQNIGDNTHAQIDTHLGNLAASGTTNSAEILTVSGHLQNEIDGIVDNNDISNALVGSDGITVTSGDPTDTISGFYAEFVAASGTLDSTIDSDISTHSSDSDAHHSRYTKDENDAILGGDNIVVVSGSNSITISSTDPDVSNALVGSDGITVTSGDPTDTISGFYTEFVAASGSLSSEIDSDISTHVADSSAHHVRYTKDENDAIIAGSNIVVVSGANIITISSDDPDVPNALIGTDGITVTSGDPTDTISGFYAEFVASSGTLSSEIDSDIATHAGDSSAHHERYTKDENDALVGSDGITIVSGSNTIDVGGFRTEFVNASGSLQTQIDAVESSDVDSINSVIGDITITGSSNFPIRTEGQTITVSGADFIDNMTHANDGGLVDSATCSIIITSDGATITLTFDQTDGDSPKRIQISGTTISHPVPDTVTLTAAGTDTNPQENWIFLQESAGSLTLTSNTTGFPQAAHARVATAVVQTAQGVAASGVLKLHAFTDHVFESLERGSIGHIFAVSERIRSQHAQWSSGAALTTTVDTGPTPDSVTVQVATGVILQLHTHTFPAIDTSASDLIFVFNDNTTPYKTVASLSEISEYSDGSSIGGTQRFNVVIWGAISENQSDSKIFLNLPAT